MPSAILCHAAADAGFAHEIRRVLELNCAVAIVGEEGLIQQTDTVNGSVLANFLRLRNETL